MMRNRQNDQKIEQGVETISVIVEPISKIVEFSKGKTILDNLKGKIPGLESPCNGQGTCGKCLVKIINTPKLPSDEDRFPNNSLEHLAPSESIVLACQTILEKPCLIELDSHFFNVHAKNAQIISFDVQQWNSSEDLSSESKFFSLDISEKKFTSLRLFKKFLNSNELNLDLLRKVKERFPHFDIKFSINENFLQNLEEELVKVLSSYDKILHFKVQDLSLSEKKIYLRFVSLSRKGSNLLGYAVDIGTTTMVGYLVDLKTCKILGSTSCYNPQLIYGDDVITRLTFAQTSPINAMVLQKIVFESCLKLLNQLLTSFNRKDDKVIEWMVVGNSTMHHLFFGLDITGLSRAPFNPTIKSAITWHFNDFRRILSEGQYTNNFAISSPPLISAFIGADIVVDVLSTKQFSSKENSLLLDFGTNCEITLAQEDGTLLATSVAAGPAFEGAHLFDGMHGETGAIEHIQVDPINFQVTIKVIGNSLPLGICGSGVVDIVAELLRLNIITRSGRFNPKFINDGSLSRLKLSSSGVEFIICSQAHPPIIINEMGEDISHTFDFSYISEIKFTQGDVREIQKVKGAFLSGILLLLQKQKISMDHIQKLYLAGGFGGYLDLKNAQFIGLFPQIDLTKIIQIGNAAGRGAVEYLISLKSQKSVETFLSKVEVMNLATNPDFSREYAKSMFFPYKDVEKFSRLSNEYKKISDR